MKINQAYAAQSEAQALKDTKSDVQSLWRKLGWQPPSEYRNDFAQSCRPAIMAGMKRLELAKLIQLMQLHAGQGTFDTDFLFEAD